MLKHQQCSIFVILFYLMVLIYPYNSAWAEGGCNLSPGLTPLSMCILSTGDAEIGPGIVGTDKKTKCDSVKLDKDYTGLGTIRIFEGGSLKVPDCTLQLQTNAIEVAGTLEVGTKAEPIGTHNRANKVTFEFTGDRPATIDPFNPADECDPKGNTPLGKGILVKQGGKLSLFGAKGIPPGQKTQA